MSQTLQEMDDDVFLVQVDSLMECLERQFGDTSVGERAVSEVKAEIRRRLLSQAGARAGEPISAPVTVEIQKVDVDDIIPRGSFGIIHGNLYVVTLSGKALSAQSGVQRVYTFFSSIEAIAFLSGLKVAQDLGFPFKEIPDIDDAVSWVKLDLGKGAD